MSDTDSIFEKVVQQAESADKENDEYLKDLLNVLLITYQEEKKKVKKDRKLMEDAIHTMNNDIARCDYHISKIKQIMVARGWTFLDKKRKKD